jgi:7-cyano-7-deazaguanine synthase
MKQPDMFKQEGTALVVLSGGQDSATCLLWSLANFEEVETISFNYQQSHSVELKAAKEIAALVGVKNTVVNLPGLFGASPLTNNGEGLELYSDYQNMEEVIGERVELTFVPMRNAIMLSLAANYAAAKGIDHLVTGVCQQDNANYPDCREEFILAQEKTVNVALGFDGRMRIHAPLLHLTKAEGIALGSSYTPFKEVMALTHTCYAGAVPPCGKCHSCLLRAEGFLQAGIPDPLVERFR